MKNKFCFLLFVLLSAGTHLATCSQETKLDCYPIEGANKQSCEALGCVWSPVNTSDIELDLGESKSRVDEPWCYFPKNYVGYRVTNVMSYGAAQPSNDGVTHRIELERARASALATDAKRVFVYVNAHNKGRLLQLRVVDADRQRFEPEIPKLTLSSGGDAARQYQHEFRVELKATSSDELGSILNIRRKSNGALLFSTDLRRLIFADKFIQLNSKLGSPYVYGLGEHYDDFLKLADRFKTYSFWNTDVIARPGGTRSYGGFPFYINLDHDKSDERLQAFGVYLRNSNAMDVVLQKDVSVTFRPIGGILDFYIMIGPSPLEVVSQFQHLVGLPALPPRWALGFHLCRYNYGSLAKTRLVSERTRNAGIPFDAQWNDIDYMHNFNDFTFDPQNYSGLPEFVGELHDKHKMRYMLLFDPGLSQEANYYPYELGEQMNIWIKNATGGTLVGRVWNKSQRTVFPDFSNPASVAYWRKLFVQFHQQVPFDGAWIDMNDISNFVDGSLDGCPSGRAASAEQTPYTPGGYALQTHTLCLSAQHYKGLEYDLHNLYSFYEAIATRRALEAARPGRRSLIISRSSHPGQGHYGGHWSGDVLSNWDYLRWSIASLLEHSMYGFSMMGSDICGFVGDTTPQLCARWSTLGAFYTFSRNHNDDTSRDQDPVAMGETVVAANRNALSKKYALLPYFYTLLHRAHSHGEPVARSLAFEFFHQQDQWLLAKEYHQFMVGPGLMVAPIVHENQSSVLSYLPKGRWYATDILPQSAQSAPLKFDSKGELFITNNVTLDNLVLFVRGGHILPVYTRVGATTEHTVENQPFSLEVALCQQNRAHGRLILDDGESIQVKANHIDMQVMHENSLVLTMIKDDFEKETRFGQVKVFGVDKQVSEVRVVGNASQLQFTQESHMLKFDLDAATVSKQKPITVEWV